jgi:hypothetical protein
LVAQALLTNELMARGERNAVRHTIPTDLTQCEIGAIREHYDGSGYPDKCKGDDLPLASRILVILGKGHF